MSSVAVARLTSGRHAAGSARGLRCDRTVQAASFIGPAIQRGLASTRAMPHVRKRGERVWRIICCAAVFVASAIPHPTSMPDRLCFTWTRLRSMDRPSVVVRTLHRLLRIGCTHTESAIPRLAHACQQKATVSSRFRRKKCVHDEMRCIDVTESRRDIAVAAVCSARDESLSALDRSARTARSRGRCSWRSGGSACCRRAAP